MVSSADACAATMPSHLNSGGCFSEVAGRGSVSKGAISYPRFTLTSQSTSMYTTSLQLSGILMGTV
jgi:hypothetical protein